jgi:hypothetical protein
MADWPFHSGRDGAESADDEGRTRCTAGSRPVDRRDFLRTALAVGGPSALTTVTGCAGRRSNSAVDLEVPSGPSDLSTLPERQHAWNADLTRDESGTVVLPRHQTLLLLDYWGEGTPTEFDRETVEEALRSVERSVQRLTGGEPTAANEGLVVMLGYSRTYFDRFREPLPASVDLQRPATVLSQTGEDAARADSFDAVLLLASDSVPVLLAVEEALFGEVDQVNGVDVAASLDGVFERVDRRTAYAGPDTAHDRLDEASVDGDPRSIRYTSGSEAGLASEDAVTIRDGPFAEGTTMQVSRLRLDLDAWEDIDRESRDDPAFSGESPGSEIGDVGETLEDDSGVPESIADDAETRVASDGRVGHSASLGRARDEPFDPLILRRSEGIDDAYYRDGRVVFNTTAVMEEIGDFVETRLANDAEFADDVPDEDTGIVSAVDVRSRATFLIPPRRLRALPPAAP